MALQTKNAQDCHLALTYSTGTSNSLLVVVVDYDNEEEGSTAAVEEPEESSRFLVAKGLAAALAGLQWSLLPYQPMPTIPSTKHHGRSSEEESWYDGKLVWY